MIQKVMKKLCTSHYNTEGSSTNWELCDAEETHLEASEYCCARGKRREGVNKDEN